MFLWIAIGLSSIMVPADWFLGVLAKPSFNNTNIIQTTDNNFHIPAIPGHNITVVCGANISQSRFSTLTLYDKVNGKKEDNNIIKSDNRKNLLVNRILDGQNISHNKTLTVNCTLDVNDTKENRHIIGTVTTYWLNEFSITAGEANIHETQSAIEVSCSLPEMTPPPNVTLRYQGENIATNNGSTDHVKYQLNVTKEDNGRLVDCCIDIPLAGDTCINTTLNVSYPPQNAAIMIMSVSKVKVIVKCTTEVSNPASNIMWSVEGANWTLPSKMIINLGSHSGHVSSQTIEVTDIYDNLTITCNVTNDKFPNLILSKSTQVNIDGMFLNLNEEHIDTLWILTIGLLAVSSFGLVCLIGAGTVFLVKHRPRHSTDPSLTEYIKKRGSKQAERKANRYSPPENLVYVEVNINPNSPKSKPTTKVRGQSQQVEYVSIAFPKPDPVDETLTENVEDDVQPGVYSNFDCHASANPPLTRTEQGYDEYSNDASKWNQNGINGDGRHMWPQNDQHGSDAGDPENWHARQDAIIEHIQGDGASGSETYGNYLPPPPLDCGQMVDDSGEWNNHQVENTCGEEWTCQEDEQYYGNAQSWNAHCEDIKL